MTGFVYFIQVGADGPIKIGYSRTDPLRRMGQLRAGCPWELRLVGAIRGTKFDEKRLHEKFSQFKLRQEWFCPDVDIREILFLPALRYRRRTLRLIVQSRWRDQFLISRRL